VDGVASDEGEVPGVGALPSGPQGPTGIGFSVQHDANHGSYSSRRGVNRLVGWTLDCIGGSSYVWNWKHTLPHDWAAHQLQSTVDFARGNPLVSWYLGGLNFQVVHHLFPRVCHLHYPALSLIVEDTCREHGVNYRVNESVGAALKSHVRWLKRMGQPVIEGAV